MIRPHAVLLDAGGVFLLPEPERIVAAIERAGCEAGNPRLHDAHYRAAARFTTDLDVEADWNACWQAYLEEYVDACGIPDDFRADVHLHLDNEFADAALWNAQVPGCVDGLRALAATGVRLGVVSNADGLIAERLRAQEILQVGPGMGVPVECVIDSGVVGVMKPDARIFEIALTAMGLEARDVWYVGDMPAIDVVGARRAGITPFVVDPLGVHADADYGAVASLTALASLLAAEG
jgi:putative hydrolase of the HAD superfamily